MEVVSNNIDLSYVKRIQDKMRKHQFMLCYRGFFTHDLIKSILALSEKKMDIEETQASIKKKVFNVMVECLQNVCKGDESQNGGVKSNAVFMLGKSSEEYVIYSGNIIENHRIEKLDKELDSISGMNKQELKDLYLSLISNADDQNDSKIVIGILDIAKKTGNQIDYSFIKIDSKNSFFTLNTSISNPN